MGDAAYLRFGPLVSSATSAPAFATSFQIDASDEGVAWVLQMPEADTITKVRIRYGARTGTPPTYRVSLQGLSATGTPDGTVKGGGSPVSVTFTPPATTAWDGTVQEFTFANSYTAARGELICVVVDYSSGTIDGSNRSSFVRYIENGFSSFLPYTASETGGTWTNSNTGLPTVAVVSASTTYGSGMIKSADTTLFGSDHASADERGVAFTIPADWCATYKLVGVRAFLALSGTMTGKTYRWTLYDTDKSSVLQQIDIDSDHLGGTAGSSPIEVFFNDTPATLNAGSMYYLTLAPQDTGATQRISYFNYEAAADAAAGHGLVGNMFQLALYNDGAWVSTTSTSVPLMSLILDDITKPTGGGRPAFSDRTGGKS